MEHTKNNTTESPAAILERQKLEPLALADYGKIELEYPINGNILPTRLGNILRASERYPFEKYQIESLSVFPRLVHIFPKEFQEKLEETNNKFIFLLNSSFLSFFIGISAILLTFTRLPCYLLNPAILNNVFLSGISGAVCTNGYGPLNFFQKGFSNIGEGKYFLIGIFFIFAGIFLYELTLTIVKEYSLIIRSGFDLYRYQLFAALSVQVPKDFKTEKMRWLNISTFLIAGEDGLSEIKAAITPPSAPPADSSPKPLDVNVNGNLHFTKTRKKE